MLFPCTSRALQCICWGCNCNTIEAMNYCDEHEDFYIVSDGKCPIVESSIAGHAISLWDICFWSSLEIFKVMGNLEEAVYLRTNLSDKSFSLWPFTLHLFRNYIRWFGGHFEILWGKWELPGMFSHATIHNWVSNIDFCFGYGFSQIARGYLVVDNFGVMT